MLWLRQHAEQLEGHVKVHGTWPWHAGCRTAARSPWSLICSTGSKLRQRPLRQRNARRAQRPEKFWKVRFLVSQRTATCLSKLPRKLFSVKLIGGSAVDWFMRLSLVKALHTLSFPGIHAFIPSILYVFFCNSAIQPFSQSVAQWFINHSLVLSFYTDIYTRGSYSKLNITKYFTWSVWVKGQTCLMPSVLATERDRWFCFYFTGLISGYFRYITFRKSAILHIYSAGFGEKCGILKMWYYTGIPPMTTLRNTVYHR